MTDPRKQSHAPYLRSIADRMGLRDWRFDIADHPPRDGAMASVSLPYGQRVATVYLSEAFLDASPESRRATIVHELTHAHLEPAWEVADDALPEPVRPAYRRLMEYATDAIARAWAETLPLPPKVKPCRGSR